MVSTNSLFLYLTVSFCSGKGYGQMNKKISKLGIQMNNIRHNNAVLSIDTDIRYLQIKACSLQKLTSTTIQRVRIQ